MPSLQPEIDVESQVQWAIRALNGRGTTLLASGVPMDKILPRRIARDSQPVAGTMTTHYETLGIPREASAGWVKRSYRSLVKIYHPDRYPSESAEKAAAEKKIREINEAYSVLSKPTRRASYDARLGSQAIFCTEMKPERCSKCGKPTGYWDTLKRTVLCHRCAGTIL